MHDWTAFVRARLREVGDASPPADFVEEFALHLAQAYEEARANGAGEAAATAAAVSVLDASHSLQQALQAKQLPRHGQIGEWARREPNNAKQKK